MRGVHSLHPRPLGGLFLCFGSELGGGAGASDPSTDSQASCLKKSAGEWYGRGSRVGCASQGHLPFLGAHMHTQVHTCFPSQLYFFIFNKVPRSSPPS